mmetsp:Transcript_7761/g.18786  ORF Transcript_7761/g.18786 Transcript_7761/m.18786 type:complete len:488 (+) Transcript_7761:359-1822(+)|eukprot:CAMPEP_0178984838 /NCGR_PEP_ID=MMETSP0795-20121207/1832_1 /TAXON_ID=88552 /ORGANISM="Amoebophrya sp., Strain Ameob2" /LENGTH=487 /DNA_ID=CAMNT_0020675755 /DNA_START=460 /DNA_END=1923 /DNA_ORIENTATION=+
MSTLRGSWCVLVTTVTSIGDIFPAVRHRHLVATATAAAAPRGVHPPAVDEDGLTESMAGLRLYHLHPRTGGELEQRSVGILVNSDAGIFRTGRRDFSGHAVVDHKHPRLAKLESHTVGIVNSGRGEAKWIGKGIVQPRATDTEEPRPRTNTNTNTRSLSVQELPEEVLQRVAAFSVNLGPSGDVRATRIGQGTSTLLDRLDVLGPLAAFADDEWAIVRNRYDEWSTALQEAPNYGDEFHENVWRARRPSLEDIFRADGRGPDGEEYVFQRRAFRRLCDATSSLLRSTVGLGTLPGRLRTPQRRWSLRLRPGAQVRVKPWKAHGTDFEGAGSHQFEEYSYWRGEALFETDPEPFFLWWSSYLEGYANAEQTGEVVEFLPPGTFAGLPPGPGNHQGDGGYLVRFPLPALPWTPDGHLRIGEPGAEEVGSDEELPLGGWRLTPATRLPNGQNVLLLEVPRSRLYVDVAAHTDDRRQTNGNPFETVPVLTP